MREDYTPNSNKNCLSHFQEISLKKFFLILFLLFVHLQKLVIKLEHILIALKFHTSEKEYRVHILVHLV